MFDALCLVVGGGMGLSVLDKVKSLKPKQDVAPQQPQQPQQPIAEVQEIPTQVQEENV